MYGSQSTQALLPYKQEKNVWQSVHMIISYFQVSQMSSHL